MEGSRNCVRVDRTGEIKGFGKIGATVGLAKKASANILAQARLIDAGYGVRYDSARDQYKVDTDSKPMKFTRKVNRGGKRSPHYTHVIERAYVETMAGNKARFTRREGEAGEASIQVRTRVVERGDRSSRERNQEPTDCRRRYEEGKDDLKTDGGFHEGEDQPAKTVDSDARPQCKSNPSPAESSRGHHVRLRNADTTGTPDASRTDPGVRSRRRSRGGQCLIKFISTARGRGFDTKYIRTDGEGAIATLKEDLKKNHRLVVETTGSGTHVEEIERMSQTLKKRVRCHFHDLPFVMGRTMLKKNKYGSVEHINRQDNSVRAIHRQVTRRENRPKGCVR